MAGTEGLGFRVEEKGLVTLKRQMREGQAASERA